MTQTTKASADPAYKKHRWLIIITVMLVASIEVLDSTIVNVALPSLVSGLSTNAKQVTWVLTAYIIASAIFIPLTGFLEGMLGRRYLLLMNIVGFAAASMLCGVAVNLSTMVPARIIQGIFGATLIPLSQAILKDSFTLQEQPTAMAIWGIGIMATPVLGPTIGGIITEHLTWRWIFYVNLPICTISFLIALWVLPTTPRQKRKIDWKGLILIVVGLGGLQLFLDRGPDKDWFDSAWLTLIFLGSVLSISTLVFRGFYLPTQETLINLRLFKDRNFSVCTFISAIYCAALFSVLMLQPMMLQNLFHYPVLKTALVMSPRAITCAIAMGLSPQIVKRFDIKLILLLGLIIFNYGTYLMTLHNFHSSAWDLIYPGLYQGIGMGLIFPPLTAFSLINIPKAYVAEASGLYGYGRFLGSAVGISTLSTLVNTETQIHWHRLTEKIHLMNPTFLNWWHHHPPTTNLPMVAKQAAFLIYKQATLLAFINGYQLSILLSGGLLFFVFFLDSTAARKLNEPDSNADFSNH